jgi:hypothetical protein
MRVAEQPLVARCLSTGESQSRIAWIEGLARSLFGNTLVTICCFAFSTCRAAAEVRRMVEQEQICGAFLAFDLDQRADTLCVTITVSEAAREAAHMLFGQFLGG